MNEVPVVLLFGQSNASLPGLDAHVQLALRERGVDAAFLKVADGGTSLHADPVLGDWSPSTEGEMYDRLLNEAGAYLQGIRDAGFTPRIVGSLWVQGEGDSYAQEHADAYAANLRGFFKALWTDLGQGRFPITIAELSREKGYWTTVRDAQREVAAEYDNVDSLDTTGLTFYDRTHYDPRSQSLIASTFVSNLIANTPDMPTGSGYAFPNPELVFSANDDAIRGTVEADRINGFVGDDLVFGRGGADTLIGATGDDVLRGGAGNDLMLGGGGYDALEGGTGNDRFRFLALSESMASSPDRILDFEAGLDRIDFGRVDADATTAGNGTFQWSEAAFLSGIVGEMVGRITAKGTTIISGDVDGDAQADLRVVLMQAVDLSASDFLL